MRRLISRRYGGGALCARDALVLIRANGYLEPTVLLCRRLPDDAANRRLDSTLSGYIEQL
jgi:hypothetical protein